MRKAEKVAVIFEMDGGFEWKNVYPSVEPDGRTFLYREDPFKEGATNIYPFMTLQNCQVVVDWGDVDENYRD